MGGGNHCHLGAVFVDQPLDDVDLLHEERCSILVLGAAAHVSRPKLISSPSDMDYCISNNDNMTRMTHLTSDATSFQPRQICVVHGVVSELWML